MDADKFGKYLKSLRNEKNLTLTQLGKLAGYSNPYLSQIENGHKGIPSPETLEKLAPHLGISHTELMFKAGYISMEEVNKRFSFFNTFSELKNGLEKIKRNLMRGGKLVDAAKVQLVIQLSKNQVLDINPEDFMDTVEAEVNSLMNLSKAGKNVEERFYEVRPLLNVLNYMIWIANRFSPIIDANQLAMDFNTGDLSELSDKEMHQFDNQQLLSEAAYKIVELFHQFKENYDENSRNSFYIEKDIEKVLAGFAESVLNKENPKELVEILSLDGITYSSHSLTEQDRQRILDMLKLLFPDR